MFRILTMPIKYDWVFTSLSNMFKQFNNNGLHSYFFSEEKSKKYLKKYN
jgi:hypothetical protein